MSLQLTSSNWNQTHFLQRGKRASKNLNSGTQLWMQAVVLNRLRAFVELRLQAVVAAASSLARTSVPNNLGLFLHSSYTGLIRLGHR